MVKLKSEPQPIGWTEQDDIQLDGGKLAIEDVAQENFVGCCQTDFHVIDSEEAFEALLKALRT